LTERSKVMAGPGRRPARRPRTESRRTEIVRSFGRVVQERGPAGATMEQVADRLGMTKGSLYYYFRDKDDLLYECHRRANQVSLDALARQQRSDAPPDLRLREVLVGHIRGITDEVYGAAMLTDLESIRPARRRRLVAMRDRFERGVREIVREGVGRGVFGKVDPRVAGFAILGAINWIPMWYDPRGALSAEEVAEQFADLLVRALRT
jgi:AcrR family transcriptional regulator